MARIKGHADTRETAIANCLQEWAQDKTTVLNLLRVHSTFLAKSDQCETV